MPAIAPFDKPGSGILLVLAVGMFLSLVVETAVSDGVLVIRFVVGSSVNDEDEVVVCMNLGAGTLRERFGHRTCASTIITRRWYMLLTYGAAESGHAAKSTE